MVEDPLANIVPPDILLAYRYLISLYEMSDVKAPSSSGINAQNIYTRLEKTGTAICSKCGRWHVACRAKCRNDNAATILQPLKNFMSAVQEWETFRKGLAARSHIKIIKRSTAIKLYHLYTHPEDR